LRLTTEAMGIWRFVGAKPPNGTSASLCP